MHTSNVLGAWILTAADRIRGAADAVGLAERELAALVLVSTHPGTGIDWLYRRLGLTQSGGVRLVARLVELGLVERAGSGGRSGVQLTLTQQGRALLALGLRARAAAIDALLAPFDATEAALLVTTAEKGLAAESRQRLDADIACRLCDWQSCGEGCPIDQSVGPASTGS